MFETFANYLWLEVLEFVGTGWKHVLSQQYFQQPFSLIPRYDFLLNQLYNIESQILLYFFTVDLLYVINIHQELLSSPGLLLQNIFMFESIHFSPFKSMRFYAPGSNDQVHIGFFPVCLFVCLSVCLSVVNFNLRYIFWTVRDRDFIYGMHTLLMMPFQMTLRSMTLWPWLWPLCKNSFVATGAWCFTNTPVFLFFVICCV